VFDPAYSHVSIQLSSEFELNCKNRNTNLGTSLSTGLDGTKWAVWPEVGAVDLI